MHLNVLYRAAQAGHAALADCARELSTASRRTGLLGFPFSVIHRRHARLHLADAKRHLQIVRDNITMVAALSTKPVQIDSSGGYAIADLLAGGLLDAVGDIRIDGQASRIEQVNNVLAQVNELMLRMRKAGAVS